jgi:dienelactone hydrolase
MAEIVLFHHVLGQTDGFLAFAAQLRDAGHTVHTPDLFDGATFNTIGDGVAFAKETGFAVLAERGVQSVEGLPNELVYAGFSMGVMAAQQLTQLRPGARGALLFEACIPTSEWGSWPADVPVQIHGMENDEFFAGEGDINAARALVDEASETATAELFIYPGDGHLFADSSSSSYDSEAAALLTERALDFLRTIV